MSQRSGSWLTNCIIEQPGNGEFLGFNGTNWVNVPSPGGGGMSNPMTSVGDMIVGGVSGTPARFALGTPNQIMTVDNSGTAEQWDTSGFYPNPMTAPGDLIVGGASGAVSVLAPGADGTVLTANVGATDGLQYLPGGGPTAMQNGSLFTSASGDYLYINLGTNSSSVPSPSNPVYIYLKNATSAGSVSTIKITGSFYTYIPSGTTIGTTNNYAGPIYVYFMEASQVLGVSLSPLDTTIQWSTSATAGGTDPSALYTTTALSSQFIQYLGKVYAPQTTAGTWAANSVQVSCGTNNGGDYPSGRICALPGDIETVNSSGKNVALPMGTPLQLLSVNAAGTGLQWGTSSGFYFGCIGVASIATSTDASAKSLIKTTSTTFINNPGSAWNNATGIFTVPTEGIWQMSLGLDFAVNASLAYIYCGIVAASSVWGDTEYISGPNSVPGSASNTYTSSSGFVYLSVGDQITWFAAQNSGAALVAGVTFGATLTGVI